MVPERQQAQHHGSEGKRRAREEHEPPCRGGSSPRNTAWQGHRVKNWTDPRVKKKQHTRHCEVKMVDANVGRGNVQRPTMGSNHNVLYMHETINRKALKINL